MAQPHSQKRLSPWISLYLVLGVCALFGLVGLPLLSPSWVGKTAPDFALPVIPQDASKSRVHLNDLRGSIVILDFWASWCAPCRQQSAILHQWAQSHPNEKVIIVGVNTQDDLQSATRFVNEHPASYSSVFDTDDEVSANYEVQGLPTVIILSATGRIVSRTQGVVDTFALDEMLQTARQPG